MDQGAHQAIVHRPWSMAQRGVFTAVLGLALVLRLWAVDWQLPGQFHPDEGHYVWKAVDMLRDGNPNPKYFRNPSLYTYLLWGQFGLLEGFGGLRDALGLFGEAFRPPSLYPLLGRLTSALLGVGTVAATAALGGVLLGRGVGLLGALFLAVSFLHVRDSHFATNDVPATFFLTLSVLSAARLAAGQGRRHALWAGLWGGLATSAKYNAGFFAVPLAVAAFWPGTARRRDSGTAGRRDSGMGRWRDGEIGRHSAHLPSASRFPSLLLSFSPSLLLSFSPSRRLAVSLSLLLGAGAVSLLAYLVGTPYTVLDWPSFRADFEVQRRFSRGGWEGQGDDPVGLLYLGTLVQGMGPLTLGLAAVGALLLARRRPLAAGVLLGYPAAYLLFMLSVKLFFARFATTLVPFLCLAAAYGVVALAGLVRAARWRVGVATMLVVLAAAPSLWSVVVHNRLLQQDDTRVLAFRWLEANARPGAKLAIDDYSIRDRRPRADLPERGRFDVDIFAGGLGEHDLAWYRERGFEYLVLSSFQYQRFPGKLGLREQLEQEARQVAVFSPSRDGVELPFDIEELYSPFWGLERYARPGPTVRIYAIR